MPASPFRGSLAPIPGGICRAKCEVLREMVANLANLRYVFPNLFELSPVSMNRFERRPLSAGEAESNISTANSGFCVPALSCAAQ